MKQTINEYQFADAFRSIRPDNFSYEGLKALYEYLEQLGEDIGEEIELDVIAICCDYSEYTSDNIQVDFQHIDEVVEADDIDDALEALQDHTTVLIVNDDTYIIQDF